MSDNTVIAPTTSAASFDFSIIGESTVSIFCPLGLAEKATLLYGTGSPLVYFESGLTLTRTAPFRQIKGPGNWRVSKGATIAAAGVYIDGEFEEV